MEGAIAASSRPFPFSGGILLSLGYDLTGAALPSQRASICKSRFSNNGAIVFDDGTNGGGLWGRYPQVCGKTGNFPLPAALERIDYFASALSAANAQSCARYVAMKDLNRNGRPFPPLTYRCEEQNDLRVCRVLSDCALITIESVGKLRTAKGYMHRIAAHVPDSCISVQQRAGKS